MKTVIAYILALTLLLSCAVPVSADDGPEQKMVESVVILGGSEPQTGREITAEVTVNGETVQKDFYSLLAYQWQVESPKGSNEFMDLPGGNKRSFEIPEEAEGYIFKVVVTGVSPVTGQADAVTESPVRDMTYTLSYDKNGAVRGSVPESETLRYSSEIILAGNTGKLVKPGSVFAGWKLGDALFREDCPYTVTGDAAFQAAWLNTRENVLTLGNGDVCVGSDEVFGAADAFAAGISPGESGFTVRVSKINGRETELEAVSGCALDGTGEYAGDYGIPCTKFELTYSEEDIYEAAEAKLKITVKNSGYTKQYDLTVSRPEAAPLTTFEMYDNATGEQIPLKEFDGSRRSYSAVIDSEVENVSVKIAPENFLHQSMMLSMTSGIFRQPGITIELSIDPELVNIDDIELKENTSVIAVLLLNDLMYMVFINRADAEQ